LCHIVIKIMKSFSLISIALLAAFTLSAQNEKKSEIQIKIIKDGKTVKDTVYMVEDGKAVEHASKILDMTFGEPKAGENYKVMTFISDDGEMHEFHSGDAAAMKMHKMHAGNAKMGEEHEGMMRMIHESDDDTQVFVTTEEGEDGETRVMVKKIKISEDGKESTLNEKENVYIIKGDKDVDLKHFEHNGEEPVWIEKDGAKILIIDSKDGSKKKIMVVTDSESDYEFKTEDGEKIIIHTTKAGNKKKEVNVEVIVEDENATLKTDQKKDKKKKK